MSRLAGPQEQGPRLASPALSRVRAAGRLPCASSLCVECASREQRRASVVALSRRPGLRGCWHVKVVPGFYEATWNLGTPDRSRQHPVDTLSPPCILLASLGRDSHGMEPSGHCVAVQVVKERYSLELAPCRKQAQGGRRRFVGIVLILGSQSRNRPSQFLLPAPWRIRAVQPMVPLSP